TRRYDDARGMLLAFANSVDRGMLPNRFPDAGEMPEYNTVDATLWFFEAVRAFAAHTEDYDFIRTKLYSVLADIIAWHERGTRYGIHLDIRDRQHHAAAHAEADELSLGDMESIEQLEDVSRVCAKRIVWKRVRRGAESRQIRHDHSEFLRQHPRQCLENMT